MDSEPQAYTYSGFLKGQLETLIFQSTIPTCAFVALLIRFEERKEHNLQ